MTPQTRLFARLNLLAVGGVQVFRNPTVAFTIPPAGVVVMRDAGPTVTDRSPSGTTYFTHRVELQLFIPAHQPKTLATLEADVAATLRTDRTLSGVVDQMFLIPSSWEVMAGGDGITASTFALQMEYSGVGAAL